MKSRQAIIWGRFSSDQQKDGDSKDRQDRLNRECAARKGIIIMGEYFDEGVSVKDGATEKFKKLIADLPKGVGIICENLDRINRGHPWRAKAYIADIIEAEHFILTSQDGKEYNQESIEEIETMLLGDMSTNLARMENNKRTRLVKEEKAKAVELARQSKPAPLGKWLPAHIKYNFATCKYDVREDKKAVIKKIFSEYSNGKGVVAITKDLNLAGIPTFRCNGKIGGWQRSTVFTLLRYEGVIGVFNYLNERIPNAWQPAISEELFYQVQSILETNKVKHGNYASNTVNNILRGVAKCPHCGSTIKVTKDNYIACSGYMTGRCKIKNMIRGYREIEFEFARWFVPMAKDALMGKNETIINIEILTTKKNALTGKIEATLDLLDSGIAPDVVKARMAKLDSERIAIDNEIALAKSNSVSNAILPETFKRLETMIDGIPDDQDIRKKVSQVVPTIVKRVDIDLSDKWFPSFMVHLINGEQIKWEYNIAEYAEPIIAFGKNGTMKLGKGKVIEGSYVLHKSAIK